MTSKILLTLLGGVNLVLGSQTTFAAGVPAVEAGRLNSGGGWLNPAIYSQGPDITIPDCGRTPNHVDCLKLPPAENCKPAKGLFCSEKKVNYRPQFPELGKYSVPGVCAALDHGRNPVVITLKDGEHLQNAWKRLLKASSRQGGVLQIPHDVDTLQCDRLRVVGDHARVGPVTIRGLLGPNGEQPRFYCRYRKNDGTTPGPVGEFMMFAPYGKFVGSKANPLEILVENLHIDGYNTAIHGITAGKLVVRNNYIHHTNLSGITNNPVSKDWKDGFGSVLEYCGNEISHSGQGNAHHAFYMHRGPERMPIKVKVVDNVIHSCRWSSCFKSTANENLVSGNKFYKTKVTDPSYRRLWSQMLVDIPACTKTTVENNYFDVWYPDPKVAKVPPGVPIGVRIREELSGCDWPNPRPYNNKRHPNPWSPNYDSPFWTKEYWDSLGGKKVLPFYVKNNVFRRTGYIRSPKSAVAIRSWGTYPNYASRQFGPACHQPEKPEWWYERSRVYANGNTYIGEFSPETAYRSNPVGHSKRACGVPMPLPDKREFDLIEPGENEVFLP